MFVRDHTEAQGETTLKTDVVVVGSGPGGAALDPKPASFGDAAFWADRTDEQVALAISGGGAAVGKSPLMPAWGAMYNDAQVQAMVTYLKSFQQ